MKVRLVLLQCLEKKSVSQVWCVGNVLNVRVLVYFVCHVSFGSKMVSTLLEFSQCMAFSSFVR